MHTEPLPEVDAYMYSSGKSVVWCHGQSKVMAIDYIGTLHEPLNKVYTPCVVTVMLEKSLHVHW